MKPDSAQPSPPSRREFLQRLAGGIVVFVILRDLVAAPEASPPGGPSGPARPGVPTDFNAFVRIGEDGRVTGFTGKIEMGQGVVTSLAQMLAEELEVPLDSVEMVMGDTERCPWDLGTFGSMTTRFFGPALRAAAAEAKGVLLELAGKELKVPAGRLIAQAGVVFDREDPTRRISYGTLAKGQRIERHLQVRPSLKDVAEFSTVGRSVLRRDGREKVTGKAHYAGDMRLPGMLYACLLRPPAHGAKLTRLDLAPARNIAGALVVQEPDLVAVLHELPDLAAKALSAVTAAYDLPAPTPDDRTIFDHLLRVAPEGKILAQGGDLKAGREKSARTFANTFLNDYVAHAPIETHAALAQIENGKATVWASTQNPFGARDEIARAIGFPVEKVRVITPFVGGGFGGKTLNTQAVEAAKLAKAVGRPVQVMWSREEEFFHDTFRPAAIVKISSGLDAAGKVIFWDYAVFYAGDRGAAQFYAIPDHRTVVHGSNWQGPPGSHPFATGPWRAPGTHANGFGRETQMDQMAAAAGADSVAFRLAHLDDPRMIRVLRAVAASFGWKPAPSPTRRGVGVACGIDAGTYVATMAEVSVEEATGAVRVHRVHCAQDMGLVINPEGAKMQIEGCITMGLGYALEEQIHFEGGKILDTNFGTYRIPRFSWLPAIETILVENSQTPPQGGGEPAISIMGAVIANAIHDATGVHLLQLPMTPERILAALALRRT